MKDDLNLRRPQCKTTSMEDDFDGRYVRHVRQPKWKMTSIKDDPNEIQPQFRRPPWKMTSMKTTSMEEDLN